ncbi:MAG: hypothetical protein IKY67_04200 [Paludibacteraceae bacterium]|nr:hypothetical protein [Paludibacteraceae bacterium]
MKKIIFFYLSFVFILGSCSKETSVEVVDVQESPRSLDSLNSDYVLYKSLHGLYFNFFSGGIDEGTLDSEFHLICAEYGFAVNYYDSCEVSELCMEYLEQIQGAYSVSIADLLSMFDGVDLTNEEKLSLCITAAAINSFNRYIDVYLVMETNEGKFVIDRNPVSYISDYGLNITNPNTIIYQPYAIGTFSVLEFSNSSDFVTALDAYYANEEEETEEDCLNTYREKVEQAEMDWATRSLSATVCLLAGPQVYGTTLATCLIEYGIRRMIYWGEYMDCLESIQKVIFIQP